MMLCGKCKRTVLAGDLVRVVCVCNYISPTDEGYYLDFISQEYIEHEYCYITPWYEKIWLKFKVWRALKH